MKNQSLLIIAPLLFAVPVLHAAKSRSGASIAPASMETLKNAYVSENGIRRQLDDHELRLGKLERVSFNGSPASSGGTASSATPPTPVTTSAAARTYTVKSGDTLMKIARKFGTSADAIQKINSIKNPAALKIGQTLRLPGGGGSTTAKTPAPAEPTGTSAGKVPTAGVYIAKKGETIYSIAKRHGVSENQLLSFNNIKSAKSLREGQSLKIPGKYVSNPEYYKDKEKEKAGPSLPPGWRQHEVKKGESLSSIASKYDITRSELQHANKLSATANIHEGDTLSVPPRQVVVNTPPKSRNSDDDDARSDRKSSGQQAEKSLTDDDSPRSRTERKPAEREDDLASMKKTVTYTVNPGDDIDSLANDFNTSPETIREMNSLGATEPIKPGQHLLMPRHSLFSRKK